MPTPRSDEETLDLFDRYLISTRVNATDVYDIRLGDEEQIKRNVEEQLVLYNRRIMAADIELLKEYMIQAHPFLTRLHLNHNKVGPGGAAVLATLLQKDSCKLQELFLNKNYLYDDGVGYLAKALESNTLLRQLKIAQNHASDIGAKSVAAMIKINSTLKGLEFDGNSYTNIGQGYLADALNLNRGLKVVQFGESHNIISRLGFVRMMINTEDPAIPRTSAVLCFSKDKNNDIIDMILEEWRLDRQEGRQLYEVPREKLTKFRKFNRLSENDVNEIYQDLKALLKSARKTGTAQTNQAKILLLGRAGAGKTSFANSLIAGRSLLTGDGEERATTSVDILRWTIPEAKCTFWDFGGQEEYYMTHSFFVTRRCLVMICVNLQDYEDTDESFAHHVQYFVDSTQSHTPGAKFVILGTHSDMISPREAEKLKESLYTRFNAIEQERLDRIEAEISHLNASDAQNESEALKNASNGPSMHSMASSNDPKNLMMSKSKKPTLKERLFSSSKKNKNRLSNISNDSDSGNNRNSRSAGRRVIKSNRLTGKGHFAELTVEATEAAATPSVPRELSKETNVEEVSLELEPGREQTPRRKLISRAKGIVENDGLTVEVTLPEKAEKPREAARPSSKAGRLTSRAFEPVAVAPDPRKKLRDEALDGLKEIRQARPQLLLVYATTSTGDSVTVNKKLREHLGSFLTGQNSEISVNMPVAFAKLYEYLTGEIVMAQNSHIQDYNTQKTHASSVGLATSVGVSTNRLSRVSRRKNPLGKLGWLKNRRDEQQAGLPRSNTINGNVPDSAPRDINKGPIVEMKDIYSWCLRVGGQIPRNPSRMSISMRASKQKKQAPPLFTDFAQVHGALRLLHEVGYILWYEDNELLRDIVFVDPQWVVQMLKTVIRHNMFTEGEGALVNLHKPKNMSLEQFSKAKDEFKENAILDSRLLFMFDLWRDANELQRFHMLSLMQNFDILCEQPRHPEKEPYPKYFIPVYLKSSFAYKKPEEDNLQRMKSLNDALSGDLQNISKIAKDLFDKTPSPSLSAKVSKTAQIPEELSSSTRGKEKMRKMLNGGQGFAPKNIQWRYEFKNFFPVGLFLRLLVRCHPFMSFHPAYKPTENFMVGIGPLGVNIFLHAERNVDEGIPGALTLTAVQEQLRDTQSFNSSMSDIWQVFSLFAFEIDHLLNQLPGLETTVHVLHVNEKVGKIMIPRANLEFHDLYYNGKPNLPEQTVIEVNLGIALVPLNFLIPPLYTFRYTSVGTLPPELVRESRLARIGTALHVTEAQLHDRNMATRDRIQILHKQLVTFVDKLLRMLCEAVNPSSKQVIRGFDQSLTHLKDNLVQEVMEMEDEIKKLKHTEITAFRYAGNFVTEGQIQASISVCWKLFLLLGQKLIEQRQKSRSRRKGGLL